MDSHCFLIRLYRRGQNSGIRGTVVSGLEIPEHHGGTVPILPESVSVPVHIPRLLKDPLRLSLVIGKGDNGLIAKRRGIGIGAVSRAPSDETSVSFPVYRE